MSDWLHASNDLKSPKKFPLAGLTSDRYPILDGFTDPDRWIDEGIASARWLIKRMTQTRFDARYDKERGIIPTIFFDD